MLSRRSYPFTYTRQAESEQVSKSERRKEYETDLLATVVWEVIHLRVL